MVGQPNSDEVTSIEPAASDTPDTRKDDIMEQPTVEQPTSAEEEVTKSKLKIDTSVEDRADDDASTGEKESVAVASPLEETESADIKPPSETKDGDMNGSSNGSPPVTTSPPPNDRGRPPLSKRPPMLSTRRHRSHSMDNSELSSLGIIGTKKDGEDAEFVDPLDVLPSAASTGLLEESEHLDRLEADNEPPWSPEVMDAFSNPNLDDDTPIAAALRANAEVHVSNVSKFARRIKAQNIRRFVKRAALIGKSGHVRGKPPRAPPFRGAENDIIGGSMPNIYAVKEETDDVEFMDSSIDSDKIPSATGSTASRPGQKGKELPNSAPAAMLHQRSTSQPTLPTDAWRHRSQKDYVDSNIDELHFDFGAHVTSEKDKPATAKLHAHPVPSDGIPAEVHTSPEGAGRGKLQLGHHRKTWKRRKAKKRKDGRKSYVKGKVIDGQHELYTLSIAVMLGLRTSIGMTNKQMSDSACNKFLESHDFRHTEKYVFRPKGGPKTPPHQLSHTFKFKDYCPLVFAYMRRMFGINEFEFLLSVCGNANFIEFISNAKSGQFFFYSYDGKYMIKTMTNAESKFLRRILPDYFRHCAKNPNTLITKFLGMYRVKLYHLRRNVKFVIMNSVFDTDKVIKTLYDLKGSTTGRDAKPHHDVKKDNDFRRGRPDSVMAMNPDVRIRVREQIIRDCEFFKKMKIMDYSMLVGIHYVPPKHKFAGESSHRLGESGRLSFRDSIRDVSSRTKSSQRFAQTDEQKGMVNVSGENAKATDKVFHTPAKGQEKQSRSAGGLAKPHTPMRKTTSVGTAHSAASVSSDAGVVGDATVSSLQTLEYIFEDDDDNSFLDYTNVNGTKSGHDTSTSLMASITAPGNYHVSKDTTQPTLPGPIPLTFPIPCASPEEHSISTKPDDIELKKELTTQQMFWPFHKFYDIHGRRRMIPMRCPQCEELDCACGANKEAYEKWNVAPFEPPLSNRKDRGFMMDMTGIKTPMKVNLPNGSVLNCEGKIFYFGIIDILQQFSLRKRAEAILRRYQGSGWKDASCVHPDIYADRFVSFFDECTQRDPLPTEGKGEHSSPSDGGGLNDDEGEDVEEIVFHKAETCEEEKSEIQPPDPDVETPKTKTKGCVDADKNKDA